VLAVLERQTQFQEVASLTQVVAEAVFFQVQVAQVAQAVEVLVPLEPQQVEQSILVVAVGEAVVLQVLLAVQA
jgi:hypothetical protein